MKKNHHVNVKLLPKFVVSLTILGVVLSIVISIFDAINGISSTKFLQPKKEDLRIWGLDKNVFACSKMYILVFISYIRHKIMTYLPLSIANYIRRKNSQNNNK